MILIIITTNYFQGYPPPPQFVQVAPKSYGVPKTSPHEHEKSSDDLELHHHPVPDSYGSHDHVISTPATSKYEAPKVCIL